MNPKNQIPQNFIGYEIGKDFFSLDSEWRNFIPHLSTNSHINFSKLFAWVEKIRAKANVPPMIGTAFHFKNTGDFFNEDRFQKAYIQDLNNSHRNYQNLFHIPIHQRYLPPNTEFLKILLAQLNLCSNFKSSGLIIHPPQGKDDESSIFIELLCNAQILELISKQNITICIENAQESLAFFQSMENLIKFRKQLTVRLTELGYSSLSQKFKFCFDTGHYLLFQQRDAYGIHDWNQFSQEFLSDVYAVHIHSNDGSQDQHLLPYTISKPNPDRFPFNYKLFFENCHIVLNWIETLVKTQSNTQRYYVLEISPHFTEEELISFWKRVCEKIGLNCSKDI